MKLGIGVDNAHGLRVYGFRDEHLRGLLGIRECHHHGFGSCCGTVVHGGIADVHARELGHHRLILEDVVQRALRNLGLIRCVGGEELRTLDEILHDGRCIVVVDAGTGEAGERFVEFCHRVEQLAQLHFRLCLWEVVLLAEANALGHVGIEVVERLHARLLKHRLQVFVGMWEILVH